MSPWQEIRRNDIRRIVAGYILLALLIVFSGWASWHNRQELTKANQRQHSQELRRDLELRLFAFRICLSDGRSQRECRNTAQGAVLPALTPAQTTKIVKILGQPGKAGALGPQGIRGLIGKGGLRGFQGRTGPPGQRGPQGARGPRGFQGLRGAVGHAGSPGPPGARGRVGSVGPPGRTGPAGPAGPAGPPGARGPTGPAGPPGPPGVITCPTGFAPMQLLVRLFPNAAAIIYTCSKGIQR